MTNNNFNTGLNPVAVYSNAELQKKQILEENRGKSGIYLWTNKLNGKSYVGSGVDLKNRLKNYYSLNLMETKIKLGQSAIYSAILKYGHSNFKLEILEYCERSDVIDREEYYFNLLKPEYNLLPTAGSWLGYKHSEESKNKTRASLIGKNAGENNPMFGVLGENHPRFGKTHSEETKSKMSESSGIAVEVIDLETAVRSNYVSMTKAAEAAPRITPSHLRWEGWGGAASLFFQKRTL
jgi:group I intron endonuclease